MKMVVFVDDTKTFVVERSESRTEKVRKFGAANKAGGFLKGAAVAFFLSLALTAIMTVGLVSILGSLHSMSG